MVIFMVIVARVDKKKIQSILYKPALDCFIFKPSLLFEVNKYMSTLTFFALSVRHKVAFLTSLELGYNSLLFELRIVIWHYSYCKCCGSTSASM